MSLRTKCVLLVLAFETTLAFTLYLTVEVMGTFFESAAATLTASSEGLVNIGRLRGLVRMELNHFLASKPHLVSIDECDVCRDVNREIKSLSDIVLSEWNNPELRSTSEKLQALLVARRKATVDYAGELAAAADLSTVRFNPDVHWRLDEALLQRERAFMELARRAVDNPYQAQLKAGLILSANAVVGGILGVLGLILVRRWVLTPVRELAGVTREIGRGNLEHRAPETSHDELGQLAVAVNKMAADLARIERQMIQRERLAAMGELISYVAHNIRNPLADIQASAEACRRQLPDGSQVRTYQDSIVAAIDKFQRWLRQLEHSCSPLELQAESTPLRAVVENVTTVFKPMAERRSVTIEYRDRADLGDVCIDARHFEQALAAVVGNAIEAAGEQGRVEIGTEINGDASSWTLYVSDTGPGIPAEVREKVFSPNFSTKRGGHGLGLALAKKVVELHGGQIGVDCPTVGGTVFRLTMPLQPGNAGEMR